MGDFAHGAGFLLRGLEMWRRRPGLMVLGLVPAVVVLLVLLAAFVALVVLGDDLVAWATPFADDWSGLWRGVLRVGLYLAVLVGSAVLSVVAFAGLTLAVGDPFYARIWKETERMLGGPLPTGEVGWVRAAIDGAGLVALGLATTAVVFLIGLVPLVGPVAGPVLGAIFGGRLIAGELVSRSLEARGMDRKQQKALLAPHRSTLVGFGVACHVCFFVPLGAVVMMPVAVVGSTMLAREILDAERPVVVDAG